MRNFEKKWLNKEFDQLKVVAFSHKQQHGNYLVCECRCGNKRVVRSEQLSRGLATKCKPCGHKRGAAHHAWKGCGELSKNVFNTYRHHALSIGVPFEITIEYVWDLFEKQNRRCALTGRELWFAKTYNKQSQRTASLDRKVPSLGYVVGNIEWVHRDLNWFKRDISTGEFVSLCNEVAKYRKTDEVELVVESATPVHRRTWPGLHTCKDNSDG